MHDLVSKMHAMGMPLVDAIAASTSTPAKVLGLQGTIGSLAPGMCGDAAVFDQLEGAFVWMDSVGNLQRGSMRLDTFAAVRAGQMAWREGQLIEMGNC